MHRERPLLAVLLVLVAVAGVVSLRAATIRYDRHRARLDALAAIAAAPPRPIVALLPPGDRVASADAAAAIVRRAALRAGLLVEDLSPVRVATPHRRILPATPAWAPVQARAADRQVDEGPLVCFRLTASGSGSAILRLAESLEGGRPLVRFAQWRVARTAGGGAMRLTAIVQAVGP